MQITNYIQMGLPVNLRMNEQTAVNNFFQEDLDLRNSVINQRAQEEFDAFVGKLRDAGVEVVVVNDRLETDTPDSVFPNNWVSFHENGSVVVYPMYAVNRRKERRTDIFDILEEKGFVIDQVIDYTSAEKDELFLEATGSIVMDRTHQKAYCALSARADEGLFIEFCEDFDVAPVIFTAYQSVDGKRLPIYHTNVMMCIAEDLAVICLDTIDNKKERKNVVSHLKKDGFDILEISEAQMHAFAGNMLQVLGRDGERLMVMSASARNALNPGQLARIEKTSRIISSPIDTIEACGGGSARCMMAEVFLPRK